MQSQFIDDAVDNDRAIKPLTVGCKCAATIVWYRLPDTEWTEAEVSRQRDDASRWFRRYCIDLTFRELTLDPTKPAEAALQQRLTPLLDEYRTSVADIPRARIESGLETKLERIQQIVVSIHEIIAAKEGASTLIVLFLDEWFVATGVSDTSLRRFRVSANDWHRRLIAIDRYDRGSRHMLTHELMHGLRKDHTAGRNIDCIRSFVLTNKVTDTAPRPWPDHYSGQNQNRAIGFIRRAAAFREYDFRDDVVFSVKEYLTVHKAGYVACDEGCDEEHPIDRRRERDDRDR